MEPGFVERENSNMSLDDIIAEQIRTYGPMPFSDFMDTCLYYPELGYYMTEQEKTGHNGDFFTSCNLTASFGAMIGRQLEEMWHILGGNAFTVVEYGAGTGILCHDILAYLESNPELYEKLHYCIIEISPSMVRREQRLAGKIQWYDSLDEIGGTIDCIFSNELLDNFPVHQVVMDQELMEVFVAYEHGFREVLQPADTILKAYLEELGVCLPFGFRTEINLKALEWLEQVASRLDRGFLMTIDYGGASEDLYKSRRAFGTLLCHYRHAVNDQPYSNIGLQDITAHVNFSALQHWGEKAGLYTCGLTTQAMFLLSLGFREYLRDHPGNRDKNMLQLAVEESRIVHTLLLDMGPRFKVLLQSKNLPAPRLTGLRAI